MQLSNDTLKNSTSAPYLVKNERSVIYLFIFAIKDMILEVLALVCFIFLSTGMD